MVAGLRLLASLALLLSTASAQDTGNHPEWQRWCGKAYKPEYPSFEPGGESTEPPSLPSPALHVQFKPRYSIYLEGETQGEFIVNAQVSPWYGVPWPRLDTPAAAPPVVFTINIVADNSVLVSRNVSVGTRDNLFAFNLTGLKPSREPYEVVLFGAAETGAPNVTVTSELLYLPEKKTGSVTKLDNLGGGFLFRNGKTGGKFEPLLPYGFYATCDRFFCLDDAQAQIKKYHDLGSTAVVSLSTVFRSWNEYKYMDSLDLKYQYDLRDYFRNLTAVREQVTAIKDGDALYAYWAVDEPDGWQYPFDQSVSAADAIRKIDPYHPVSVTLNCQNYYFKEYTTGADFIMADPYPIAINATFSKWGTPCNATYGDCGCDNCEGSVQDVPRRLDDLARYERWHGLWPKTKVHNPQSFHGEDYWFRDPTPAEEVAMHALALHHAAKSILSWVWPTSETLAAVHGLFARRVAAPPVRDFVVLERPSAVRVKGSDVVDAAYWRRGGEVLLSVVNGGYEAVDETFRVPLPETIRPKTLKDVVWGNGTWSVKDNEVWLGAAEGMSTNIVILQL
ncbi:glycoside hydrolase subgroup catalytic core protein [Cordyceps javanica]|uniref:Glycoside hydrolase subgroup catalytic core protein n=1 Tax=Cordyceps javanica TaxID=43265 RepID=A0A545VTS5_9HYPO|nr:glycoside hydrolase subgroup catalytic core protein [Cordyceps javanica]TQW05120.1 hypothetical protein IF2G_07057 [Cordyceps javanica]